MRVGRAEHQILDARQALAETVPRAASEARIAATLPDDRAACRAGIATELYAFSSARSGRRACSTYRQSAMITRRAKATIPMRRVTAPPRPKRS